MPLFLLRVYCGIDISRHPTFTRKAIHLTTNRVRISSEKFFVLRESCQLFDLSDRLVCDTLQADQKVL
jgi:hypothetical protein